MPVGATLPDVGSFTIGILALLSCSRNSIGIFYTTRAMHIGKPGLALFGHEHEHVHEDEARARARGGLSQR